METTRERPEEPPVAHAPVRRPHRDAESAVDRATEAVLERVAEVKPHLRGWLHAGTTPLALAAGIVLIVLSPTTTTRIGSVAFAATALLLFTVSAIYHRGTWGPKSFAFLRRFDHANIFLLIAGSYTPFTLILLQGTDRVVMLSVVWAGALLGAFFQICWPTAPRWLSTPIYLALGWAAIFYAHDFVSGGAAVTTLVVVGGALYTLGGIVYGTKKPDPNPAWFGFHEVFHTLTIAAFVCHYVAASLATYSLR